MSKEKVPNFCLQCLGMAHILRFHNWGMLGDQLYGRILGNL